MHVDKLAAVEWKRVSQLAYQAWVTSVKAALRERQRRQRHMKAVKGKESKRQERGDSQQEALTVKGKDFVPIKLRIY